MRRRRGVQVPQEDGTLSDINITPLTDVLLVLLIIFLVTATAATQNAFNMNLPKENSAATVKADADYVVISVSARDEIFLQDETSPAPSTVPELAARLTLWKNKKGTNKVAIRSDARARYGTVIRVMDASKQAGLDKIALVTQDS